jgi:uncharacterized protein YjbJ (UPF0337 family)
MDAQKFQTYWTKLQPRIIQKWSKFTQEELNQINGKQDVFLSKLQSKYGINREQAVRELNNLEREFAQAPVGASTGASTSTSSGASNQQSYSKESQPKKGKK